VGAGKVVVELTIDTDGQPKNVQVFDSTLKNNQVEQCLVDETKTIKFPSQDKPAKVKYPFAFTNS
jgi:TonB family protein